MTESWQRPLAWAIGLYAVYICALLGQVLWLNSGHFIYMIDDPYIHLDLAETWWRTGVYGVNPDGAAVSPSSSIVWPFLLAPFAQFELTPLAVNLFLFFCGLPLLAALLRHCFEKWTYNPGFAPRLALLLALPLSLNFIGLVFMGMEQLLQVLLVLAMLLGLFRIVEGGKVPRWLWAVLIIAPLVRYEMLAPMMLTAFVAGWKGHARAAMASVISALAIVGGFSLFLMEQGLEALPNSIMLRKSLYGNPLLTMLYELRFSLSFSTSVYIVLGVAAALSIWLLRQRRITEQTVLLALVVAGIGAHLVAGRFGPAWQGRYEHYLIAWCAFLLAYAGRDLLLALWRPAWGKGLLLSALVAVIWDAPLNSSVRVASGCHAIYLQQVQMQNFAVNIWQGPVALNDIGYIGYKNPYYVLDIWGLASVEARNAMWFGGAPELDALAKAKQVDLALVYTSWFKQGQLDLWYPLAILSRPKGLTMGVEDVTVYATRKEAIPAVMQAVERWMHQLPAGATLSYTALGIITRLQAEAQKVTVKEGVPAP